MNTTSGRGVRNYPELWRRRGKVFSLVPSYPSLAWNITYSLFNTILGAYEYHLWKGLRNYPELWRRRGKFLSLVPSPLP
jgi:hypothetical protein